MRSRPVLARLGEIIFCSYQNQYEYLTKIIIWVFEGSKISKISPELHELTLCIPSIWKPLKVLHFLNLHSQDPLLLALEHDPLKKLNISSKKSNHVHTSCHNVKHDAELLKDFFNLLIVIDEILFDLPSPWYHQFHHYTPSGSLHHC